jgi:uncharacterized protein YqfA (UPF0365 family)
MNIILNSTSQISPVAIIIIAGFIIFLLFIYLIPTGPWFSAKVTGVNISIAEILLLRWRKIPVEDVINGLIIAKKGGITVTSEQLQAGPIPCRGKHKKCGPWIGGSKTLRI